MHPNYQNFVVRMPVENKEEMDEFQQVMNAYHDVLNRHHADIAEELGISDHDAMQIVYLRSRSRWSQELEDRLIKAYKAGHSVICTSGEEAERLEELGF